MSGVYRLFNYEHPVNERIFFGKTRLKAPNSSLMLIVSKIFLRGMLIYDNVDNSQNGGKINIYNLLIINTEQTKTQVNERNG